MRVLSVNTSDVSGGAARAAWRIQEAVRKEGVDSKMFVRWKGSGSENVIGWERFEPKGVLYKVWDWFRNKVKNKVQHARWRRYEKTRKESFLSDLRSVPLHGALRKLDFDVLHLHWVNLRFFPLKELRKVRKPIVWTLHDSWAFCGVCHLSYECEGYKRRCGKCHVLGSEREFDLSRKVWEKKSCYYEGLNLHIVAPSRWMAQCAKESGLLGGFDVRVIPNSIDTEEFKPMKKMEARRMLGLEEGKKYVLFGAMNVLKDANKGWLEMREALKMITEKDVNLLLFGSQEPFNESVGVNVVNMGMISETERLVVLYSAADVTVVPSRSENLSCTIMESLSCGTPVVAFDLGGNGDMVVHKENGYLAKARDVEDFAHGIEWVLSHDAERLGMAGREKVVREFSMDVVGRKYAALYEELLNVKD